MYSVGVAFIYTDKVESHLLQQMQPQNFTLFKSAQPKPVRKHR